MTSPEVAYDVNEPSPGAGGDRRDSNHDQRSELVIESFPVFRRELDLYGSLGFEGPEDPALEKLRPQVLNMLKELLEANDAPPVPFFEDGWEDALALKFKTWAYVGVMLERPEALVHCRQRMAQYAALVHERVDELLEAYPSSRRVGSSRSDMPFVVHVDGDASELIAALARSPYVKELF